MTDDARSRSHRAVNILLGCEIFRRMTAKTQPARRVFNEQESVVAAVRVMASGTLSVGDRLVDGVPVALNMAERTKFGFGNGEGEPMPGRVT